MEVDEAAEVDAVGLSNKLALLGWKFGFLGGVLWNIPVQVEGVGLSLRFGADGAECAEVAEGAELAWSGGVCLL